MIAAIVPAAGLSLRMGRPKLLLPIEGVPLIARVVGAFREGGADRVVVVVAPGADAIAEAAEGRGAEVVFAPSPPIDMRASVEWGLARLAEGAAPSAVLLAPGDSPGLNSGLIARVIGHSAHRPGRIVVPRHGGRSGHPILIPWALAVEVRRLPAGVGVNALMTGLPGMISWFDVDDPGALDDLDTPEDYRRWAPE